MRLRRAKAADAKRLYTLEKSLFGVEDFPLSLWSFYYHIRHNLLLLTESEDGDIAGYVLALIRRSSAKLYSIGVARPYRAQGIALLLMRHVQDELRTLGSERTLLEVRIDNTAAIALYEQCGFVIIKTLKAFYRDGCDAYLMQSVQQTPDAFPSSILSGLNPHSLPS